jgi:HEAT repeat protein
MTRPGIVAVGAIIVAGGLMKAAPTVCALPGPFIPAAAYVGPNFSSGVQVGPNFSSGITNPAQQPPPPTREDIDKAIDRLGAFDYDERMKSARTVRRAPGTLALPALLDAATGHADGYVRYCALVLLSGYDDPRVPDAMEQAMGEVNDRLRTVAYQYFERHPDARLVPTFIKAFDKEVAEFVRPALIRAMAALGKDPKLQALLVRDVTRGQDFFRSSVIEALGDYKATYALKAISGVAQLDGPLRDDAVVAIGKIGDKSSIGMLAGLQRTAPREAQPAIATGICLLGSNCDLHRGFLARTLTFTDRNPGFQELLRGAASGLGTLAAAGDVEAGRTLFEVGIPSADPTRAPVALALAGFAVRQPAGFLERLAERQDQKDALLLLREGFDMLEEDFAEEQFFVAVRKVYFAAAENSPQRPLVQALINTLEF